MTKRNSTPPDAVLKAIDIAKHRQGLFSNDRKTAVAVWP